MNHLFNYKFINLITSRKSGKSVSTPVWFVILEEKLYVFTDGTSGKVKRIRANHWAQIAPSDALGNALAEFIPARPSIVKDDTLARRLHAAFQSKYGLFYRVLRWLNRLRSKSGGKYVFLEFEIMREEK